MTMTTSASSPRRFPGRLFLTLGLGLPVLGIVGYVVQLWLERLTVPWYMPIAATFGVVLLVVALTRAATIWRVLALLMVVCVTAAEWNLLLNPPAKWPLPVEPHISTYKGPVVEGQPFPAFAAQRADGAPFTQRDLEGEKNNLLVFFRGRW